MRFVKSEPFFIFSVPFLIKVNVCETCITRNINIDTATNVTRCYQKNGLSAGNLHNELYFSKDSRFFFDLYDIHRYNQL